MSKKEKKLHGIEKEKTTEEEKKVAVCSKLAETPEENVHSLEDVKEDVPLIEEGKQEEKTIVEESTMVEEKEKIENKTITKNHKTAIILCISFCIILLLFLLFSTIFAFIHHSKTTILSGVCIKDIDVSNLTKEQAFEKVLHAFEEKLEQPITLKHNDYELQVFPSQFDVSFTLENAVDVAYHKGRTRKHFSK